MTDIIHEFVTEVPARIRAIEHALIEENVDQLTSLTRALKAEGASYGFEIISEISAKIESALIRKNPLADCRAQIGELIKLCRQVRSATKQPKTGGNAKKPTTKAPSNRPPRPQVQEGEAR